MTLVHAVVVPSAPLLLPEHAGLVDPVPALRAACREAVSWLVGQHPDRVAVLAAPARPDNLARGADEGVGVRLGRHLLREVGFSGEPGEPGRAGGVLVVANGSATRTEKAPGHLDARATGFDEAIETALRVGDAATLRELDAALGEELWCFDVPPLRELGRLATGDVAAVCDYADDPFGVQYWVVRWTCGS
jgi:hypothetical protein